MVGDASKNTASPQTEAVARRLWSGSNPQIHPAAGPVSGLRGRKVTARGCLEDRQAFILDAYLVFVEMESCSATAA